MPVATLGGRPLLGSSPVKWALVEGTRPYYQTFDMTPEDADALFKSGGPVELVIALDASGSNQTIKNLWIINVVPGEHPFISRVLVADRRWFWKYKHVRRLYNIRRNVGFKRVNPGAPKELQETVSRVWYAAYSLKSSKGSVGDATAKWLAADVIKDVIRSAASMDKGGVPTILVNSGLTRDVPIENLEIDDQGDQAVVRALAAIPEAGVYVDYDGAVVVFSHASGGERSVVSRFPPEAQNKGHIKFVRNVRVRPKFIRVYFTTEAEVRFDFTENSTANDTVTIEELANRRSIDNVLPTPDFEMLIQGQSQAVSQGTWVTFDQAMSSSTWAFPPGIGRLDHDVLQRAFVPFIDLWSPMLLAGNFTSDSDWGARIAAIQRHYRRTYRINRVWMDRIVSLRAYLVATVDPVSGQRAPAICYSDYCILGSQRTKFLNRAQGVAAVYAGNFDGYPDPSNDITTGKVAPAVVSIEDEDQGIVHLDYRVDVYRMHDMILPSKIDIATMPQGKLTQNNRPVAFNHASTRTPIPKLDANHKAAILITVVPGAPADERALYAVEVQPNEIASLIPPSARAGLGEAEGPVLEIRVGPGVETARVHWVDSRSRDIEAIFGIPDGVTRPNLDGLVVNVDKSGGTGASLTAIARAIAAKTYASYVDRFQGSAMATLTPGIQLDGWLQEISHEVGTDGTVMTGITLRQKLDKFDLLSYLDSSTRAILMRQPQG